MENDACPFRDRRRWVEKCLSLATVRPPLTEAVRQRAYELQGCGIKPSVALHLASAEQAAADYFLSCDDRLVRRYSGILNMMNPQTFISSLGQNA